MPDQITMKELLQDPLFKQWTMKQPKLSPMASNTPPWILYVRCEGRWSRSQHATYASAYNTMVRLIKEGKLDDCSIHSKRQMFRPPIVRREGKKYNWPSPPGHRWCGLCRRPTVFKCFNRHHAFPKRIPIVPYEPRCSICGVRQSSMKEYPSLLRSRFT